MKSTGIVRKVDELGRIVLPIELRRTMGIEIKDSVEIFVGKEYIMLGKYESACVLCGEQGNLLEFQGKKVCRRCIDGLE